MVHCKSVNKDVSIQKWTVCLFINCHPRIAVLWAFDDPALRMDVIWMCFVRSHYVVGWNYSMLSEIKANPVISLASKVEKLVFVIKDSNIPWLIWLIVAGCWWWSETNFFVYLAASLFLEVIEYSFQQFFIRVFKYCPFLLWTCVTVFDITVL